MPVEYSFSPSELDYKAKKCPRCFYIHKHYKINPGDRPPPVFSSFDAVQKPYFKTTNTKTWCDDLPDGEIMELPRGACAIDFAYAVHTDIGNSCVACRVDRSFAPLSMQLESGQSVEIISSDEARPNPDWLTFVVTSKARSAIRMALKNQQENESIALGRKLLNRALLNANTSINKLDFRRLRKVFNEMGVRRLNELLGAIGNGDLMAYVAAQKLLAADNPEYEAVTVEGGGPVAPDRSSARQGRDNGWLPGAPLHQPASLPRAPPRARRRSPSNRRSRRTPSRRRRPAPRSAA